MLLWSDERRWLAVVKAVLAFLKSLAVALQKERHRSMPEAAAAFFYFFEAPESLAFRITYERAFSPGLHELHI